LAGEQLFTGYSKLKYIAEKEFNDIVSATNFIGGKASAPNKLRIYFIDTSFLDVWLSVDGDYSYHWEHRAQRGLIHRWDNAPDHPEIRTFPKHFHDGSETNVTASELDEDSEKAIRAVLNFVKSNLAESTRQT
jgi:hypothetical protein